MPKCKSCGHKFKHYHQHGNVCGKYCLEIWHNKEANKRWVEDGMKKKRINILFNRKPKDAGGQLFKKLSDPLDDQELDEFFS